MGLTITLLVLHILCMVLYIVNAVMANNKTSKVMYIICSVLWGLCAVIDIIKLVGMA